MAPAAKIILIEMSGFTNLDISLAAKAAAKLKATVVSMSFTGLETSTETLTTSDDENDHSFDHDNVAYISSSGDVGTGRLSDFVPNVLSVGATNLYINNDGTYNRETGWSNNFGIVTAVEQAGNHTVTITTNTGTGFTAGQSVRIAGVGNAGFDGIFTVTVVNDTTFTYQATTTGLGTAFGGSAINVPGNIDDGDATGFSTSGLWTTVNTDGFKGEYQTAAGTSTNTASWTFSVTANANLGLSATWVALSGNHNATNATYSVFDGSVGTANLLFTQTVDQSFTPIPNTGVAYDPTFPFQKLATNFTSATGTLIIVLNSTGNANGTLVADDIMVSIDDNSGGTGGGLSQYEIQPAYQNGKVANANTNDGTGHNTTRRLSPDVSWLGGIETLVQIVDTLGGNITFGGTSLSTPRWAGLVAIIDQGRGLIGLDPLGTNNPTGGLQALLYSLPASDFHDITSGFNGYVAGPGYDLVGGLGTPRADQIVSDLVVQTSPASEIIIAWANSAIVPRRSPPRMVKSMSLGEARQSRRQYHAGRSLDASAKRSPQGGLRGNNADRTGLGGSERKRFVDRLRG